MTINGIGERAGNASLEEVSFVGPICNLKIPRPQESMFATQRTLNFSMSLS